MIPLVESKIGHHDQNNRGAVPEEIPYLAFEYRGLVVDSVEDLEESPGEGQHRQEAKPEVVHEALGVEILGPGVGGDEADA